ncbi:MAG TPA: carbon-nitrogen hydrolase family protein [Bryobacteraceae bacterium]|jgi:predicted amidohydrolase
MGLIIAAAQSRSVAGDIARNVLHHLQFGRAAAEYGAQLLVFPELSLTGYEPALAGVNTVHPDSPCLDPLRRLAEETQMTIVAGAPLRNDRDELHLAAFAMRPDGSVSVYTKKHLHSGEEAVFTAGTGGALLRVGDSNIGLAICADTNHPEHAADNAARGANIYAAGVLITEAGYEPDTTLLQRYAGQYRMAVLMANHSGATGEYVSAGKSAMWSEDGRLVIADDGAEESLIVCTKQHGVWTGLARQI